MTKRKQKRARFDPALCPRCGGRLAARSGLRLCGCGHAEGEQNPTNEQPRNGAGRVEALLQEERHA